MLFDLFIKPIILWCIQRDMGGARTESEKHTREWQRREERSFQMDWASWGTGTGEKATGLTCLEIELTKLAYRLNLTEV